ncbi:NAD-glutamate dehydrogenase [Methylobacter psychrophilus]|uniref:NAD-glutamate dehydrogenase n=1 Tax=Methylobacter psychrophilus TaxID=96941 RepID=UPI0021D50113|nr:NAD-glutamate dehydrogenase [Methylobacter psychrophilus]
MDVQVNSLTQSWIASFQQLTERALGKETGKLLWQKYQSAFSVDYQTLVSPRYALKDLLHLEQLSPLKSHDISLLKPYKEITNYRLHFYSQQEHFLDEYIPVLENLHLRVMDQVQFTITTGSTTQFIRSFTIKTATNQCLSLSVVNQQLLATIQVILAGKSENDALNKLLVLTGMDWQEIDVLRAYRNYYLQLGHQTSKATVHHALINNPQLALCLFDYFEARFRPNPAWDDPVLREEQALFPLRLQLLDSMASVVEINDDRILRTLFNLIDATMRCNFHLRRKLDDYFIAFKINSLGIIEMPSPKPQNEIYVHAVGMEGIHLRGGKVSRGGIRWSDRPDDFRTEILGLMQTQISKNALIIPTGAKGGFVLKKSNLKFSPQSTGMDLKEAGKKAYITLIRSLLDLTDNYSDDTVIRPQNIVSYDDPDPYLVVAADKGTASFSDIANAVSADYRFWLGDAFASGGSNGYDHKALGITAQGAWKCVQRHFQELGIDTQSEAFTVVGIGSMDGDVFGNGMLLSPCIRLLAAFSGQHIFIDPTPSASNALFNERKRLFELSGSSWNDYDRTLISEGGGVYFRSDKDIPISAELKKWLGIRYKTLDGESLIRYLLAAQVDLLWLGGIGTYVKAGTEKHEEVGDRSNDNVRVNAANLGARVVGEGANLGFTQKARIEYSLRGGHINTDAVDNSAGVDTSDHEVNLKILLTGLQKKHIITDYQPLFISMTDAVCKQVLANNYAQSLCLSLDQLRSADNPTVFLQLAERLEGAGFLDRVVESFPPAKIILARPGQRITRPELAVLMAASKMYLTRQIQDQTALLHDECCECYLQAYFPVQVNAHYKNDLSAHPLANEIKATVVSNKIINQAGCSFLSLDNDSENTTILDHVACYLTFDRVLDGDALRLAIYALDNKIAADKQYHYLLELERMLTGFCRWTLLHNKKIRPDTQTINDYSIYLQDFEQHVNRQDSLQSKEQLERYTQDGLPEKLAQRLMFIATLNDFPFIVSLSAETATDFITVFKLFNDISRYLGLYEIDEQFTKMPPHDYWEQKVSSDLQADIKRITGLLLNNILLSNTLTCADYFDLPAEKQKINRYRRVYQEIKSVFPVNLMPYIALTKELERLLA